MSNIAQDLEGNFFINFRISGIPKIFALSDHLPISFFKKEKTPYVRIDAAIKWHEENKSGELILDDLRRLKTRLETNDRVEYLT